jgi:predicted transcriptional regulator
MRQKPFDDLGELQRAVLETVWELGEANVRQARARLRRKRKPAYTTILTALQNLEKAGWLKHRAEGKSYVYTATRSREEAGAGSVKLFLQRVFEGDALAMFQHLIQESKLSAAELSELHCIIAAKENEKEGKS